jgi:hypothetical protein
MEDQENDEILQKLGWSTVFSPSNRFLMICLETRIVPRCAVLSSSLGFEEIVGKGSGIV